MCNHIEFYVIVQKGLDSRLHTYVHACVCIYYIHSTTVRHARPIDWVHGTFTVSEWLYTTSASPSLTARTSESTYIHIDLVSENSSTYIITACMQHAQHCNSTVVGRLPTVMLFTCKEILSLTAVVLVFTASTEGSCVSSIAEFERIAIHENVENRAEIHRSFYGVNDPFPLSVQVVYHVNSSNGTDPIISTDPSCPPGKEIWLWIPSPVFIFIEPTKLNEYALRTMNYFTKWSPPKARILVPEICGSENTRFNILNEMTSRVSGSRNRCTSSYILPEYQYNMIKTNFPFIYTDIGTQFQQTQCGAGIRT